MHIEAIDWETQLIYEEIQCLCQSHEVEGEVHTDTSYNTLTGAIYIPFAYEENQRNTMIKHWSYSLMKQQFKMT